MPRASQTYLAVDLGASSGRVLAGQFDGKTLVVDEVHRFPNGAVATAGHLYWDVLQLWTQILDGLRAARDRFGSQIGSVAVDTWGVDFALLGNDDQLLGNPFSYRDPQTVGMVEWACQQMPREAIFAETGLQFMDFNTLFQLAALRRADSSLLRMASTFLMMPDLFHFWMTGEKVNEFTNATTTQFLNPKTRDWSRSLLQQFQLPYGMLQPIVQPGVSLGPMRTEVGTATGLSQTNVIVPGTHDTASAVMAVPAVGPITDRPDWCYISSGTWSLMGVEVAVPVINDASRHYNFTNEGGVGGTIRLLKNISGLWLIQECRRVWAQSGRDYSWEQLAALADQAEPLRSLVEADEPRFVAPKEMPNEIRRFCEETRQPIPESPGAVVRCALESLALRYRLVLQWLEELTGSQLETIHVVGGGSQNRQLCQMTANACNRPVLAGPAEATALGNVAMQAIARGDLGSVTEARRVIGGSFPLVRYAPQNTAPWDEAFERIQRLKA